MDINTPNNFNQENLTTKLIVKGNNETCKENHEMLCLCKLNRKLNKENITNLNYNINNVPYSLSETNNEYKTGTLDNNNKFVLDNLYNNLTRTNLELNKLTELQTSRKIIMFFIILSTIYFFSSASLLIANSQSLEAIEEYFLPFHNLDFIGSFIFALVEAMALIYAEIILFGEPRFFLVFFNVGLTFVAATLFLIKAEYWEVTSHWIEFSAQVFLTSIDLIFITAQFKDNKNPLYKYRFYEISLVGVLLIISVIKLFIYGDVIKIGDMDGEQLAHYLEFIGEMINTTFATMFLLVYYQILNRRIDNLKFHNFLI